MAENSTSELFFFASVCLNYQHIHVLPIIPVSDEDIQRSVNSIKNKPKQNAVLRTICPRGQSSLSEWHRPVPGVQAHT